MKKSMGIPVAAAVTAGTVVARAVARRRAASAASAARHPLRTDPARWRAVTVLRRVDEVRDAGLAPLAELGPAVEVDVRAAPDGKGTVVAARWRDVPHDHPDAARAAGDLRAALRRAKQELEIGWQVTATRSPARPAPLDLTVRRVDEHAWGGGRR